MVSGGVFNIEEGINAHIKHAHFTRLPPANFHSIWQHVPKTLPAIHAETGQRNHRISPKLGTVWHIVSQYDPICTLYRLYMCNISYICDWACHVICIDLPSSKLSPLAVAIQWATISPKLGFLQGTLRLAQLAGPGFASFPGIPNKMLWDGMSGVIPNKMKQPAAAGPSGSEACVQLLSSRSQWGASWREWWSPCPWQSWTWWGWCRSTGSWQGPLLQWDQPGQLQREQRSDHRSSHLPLELAPPSPAPWCACLLALGPTGSEHRACHRAKLAMPWTPQPLLPQLPATQPEHPAGQERKLRAKQRVPPRLPPGQGTLPSTTGPWLKLDFWLFDVLSPKPSWRCKIWATQAYHRTNCFPTLFTSLYWYQAKAKFSQPSFVTSDSKASVHWHTCNRSSPANQAILGP